MLIASLILVGCSKDENIEDVKNNNKTFDLENFKSEKQSNSNKENGFKVYDLLTKSTFKTGIRAIFYDNYNEEYGFKTYKTTRFSSDFFDFSNYKIVKDDKSYFRLKNNSDYGLKVEKGKVYFDSPLYSGLLSNLAFEENKIMQNKEVFVIAIFINEFYAPDENKALYDPVGDCGGCPFLDLFDMYGFGSNSSAAQSNLKHNLSNFQQDNCWQVTGPEESGDYGIISIWTQTYCCP